MNYAGTIIEESLTDNQILSRLKILSTKVESVTERHQTPWLKKWTLHKVEVPEEIAAQIAKKLSDILQGHASDPNRGYWYADFKNDKIHFIIFKHKIFRVDRTSKSQYDEAKNYGLSLGIPPHQVDFHPDTEKWKR